MCELVELWSCGVWTQRYVRLPGVKTIWPHIKSGKSGRYDAFKNPLLHVPPLPSIQLISFWFMQNRISNERSWNNYFPPVKTKNPIFNIHFTVFLMKITFQFRVYFLYNSCSNYIRKIHIPFSLGIIIQAEVWWWVEQIVRELLRNFY